MTITMTAAEWAAVFGGDVPEPAGGVDQAQKTITLVVVAFGDGAVRFADQVVAATKGTPGTGDAFRYLVVKLGPVRGFATQLVVYCFTSSFAQQNETAFDFAMQRADGVVVVDAPRALQGKVKLAKADAKIVAANARLIEGDFGVKALEFAAVSTDGMGALKPLTKAMLETLKR